MKIAIGKKLFGSFLAGVILFCATVGVSLHVIDRLYDITGEMETISRKVQLTGDLRLRIHQILTPVNNYLLTGDETERDEFDRTLADISSIFLELKSYQGDKRWQTVAREIADEAVNLGGKSITVLFIDDPVGNQEAARLMAEINQISQSLIIRADEFHLITKEDVYRKNLTAAAEVKKVKTLFAGVAAIAFLSLIALSFFLSVSVTRPIRKLHEGAGIIADGDLSHRLHVDSKDEIGDLALEFNRMASSLGDAKGDLDRKIRELYTLYQVSSVLISGFEIRALLGQIVHELSLQMNIDRMLVLLVDEKTQDFFVGASTHETDLMRRDVMFKKGKGLFGTTAVEGKVRVIADVAREDRVPEEEGFLMGVRYGILIPFGTRGQTTGIMAAFLEKQEGFGSDRTDLLTSVADHMAMAVENARLYDEARHLSVTDGLTGLYNHRFFRDRIAEEVRRAGRYRRPLTLVMMDLDYFKRYNDTNGHQRGDLLLRTVAEIIVDCVRTSDVSARYGGEEFVVIAPETEKQGALIMAERIRKRVEEHPFAHRESQPGGYVTMSLGVASMPDDACDADELIRKADSAMYAAKHSGRNKVMVA